MKKRIATFLKWAGLITVVLGSLYAVLLGVSSYSLRRAYLALEADGRPMKIEDIMPPEIPDHENAALLYQSAVLQLKAKKAGDRSLFSELDDLAKRILMGTPPDAKTLKQFRVLTQKKVVTDALLTLRKGTTKPGCRYDLDYPSGMALSLSHTANLRSLTRILCAVARQQATDGDHTAAWDTVITSLRLSHALKNEPFLVSLLVRKAQFDLTADTIQALSINASPTDHQNSEINVLLKSFDGNAPLVATMDSERLLTCEWIFNLSRSELQKFSVVSNTRFPFLHFKTVLRPLAQFDHAACLNLMHACTQNAKEPYSAENVAALKWKVDNVPKYCLTTRIFVRGFPTIKGIYASMIARSRITSVGLAVLRYRQKHGKYPANLDAIDKPDAIVDPFGGKQLRYLATPTGFKVYSVGRNLVDDGGEQRKDESDGDIVWWHKEKTEKTEKKVDKAKQ